MLQYLNDETSKNRYTLSTHKIQVQIQRLKMLRSWICLLSLLCLKPQQRQYLPFSCSTPQLTHLSGSFIPTRLIACKRVLDINIGDVQQKINQSNTYQLHSLWFDPIGARIHDLPYWRREKRFHLPDDNDMELSTNQ
jgi:hypothetical protein